jgi:hypothetical protein
VKAHLSRVNLREKVAPKHRKQKAGEDEEPDEPDHRRQRRVAAPRENIVVKVSEMVKPGLESEMNRDERISHGPAFNVVRAGALAMLLELTPQQQVE